MGGQSATSHLALLLSPCSAAFVVSTLAPLLPPGGRPYQTFWGLIDFSFVAWGNAQAKEHVSPGPGLALRCAAGGGGQRRPSLLGARRS